MFKFKLITFFGLLAFISAIAVVMPYTGFGQGPEGNGAMQLNCDERPCDAVARGRAAFNDRNLNDLGGNGRACSDCHPRLLSLGLRRCRLNGRTTRMQTIRSSGQWTPTTSVLTETMRSTSRTWWKTGSFALRCPCL